MSKTKMQSIVLATLWQAALKAELAVDLGPDDKHGELQPWFYVRDLDTGEKLKVTVEVVQRSKEGHA